ncbi:MAG: 16S rRNA (uracil(1498)-N(3))-methyltransferase [Acidimicrobiia bacterium]
MLVGDEGHHLQRAWRIKAGERSSPAPMAGAAGGCTQGRGVAGRELQLFEACTELAHELRQVPALTVAVSLTKGEKPELAVQKLTELGVDRVMPPRRRRGARS